MHGFQDVGPSEEGRRFLKDHHSGLKVPRLVEGIGMMVFSLGSSMQDEVLLFVPQKENVKTVPERYG